MFGSYADAVEEEICLEGLDGATPATLFRRLGDRLGCAVSPKAAERLWGVALALDAVRFYELPEPRAHDRDPPYCPGGPGDEPGSCEHRATRRELPRERVAAYRFEDVVGSLKDTLVVVGGVERRWSRYAPTLSAPYRGHLNESMYCALERVARRRADGLSSVDPETVKIARGDPKKAFYLRKELAAFGLLVSRPVAHDGFGLMTAAHLPRFAVRPPDDTPMQFLKRFYRDSTLRPLAELTAYVAKSKGSHDAWKPFRKMNAVKKLIKVENCKYRELYPDASKSEWKDLKNNREKKILCARFLPRDVEEEEVFGQEELGDDHDFGNSAAVGEPFLKQAYRCILDSGPAGLTQKEVSERLGISMLGARSACRLLTVHGVLYSDVCEVERTKVQRYYSQIHKVKRLEDMETAKSKMKEYCEAIRSKSVVPSVSASQTAELPNDAECVHVARDIKPLKKQENTIKTINRMNLIMGRVHESGVITDLAGLRRYIYAKEKDEKRTLMDIKSLHRIIMQLEKEGKLKFYRFKVTVQSSQVMLSFLCEPHHDMKHPLIQSAIREAKCRLSEQVKKTVAVKYNAAKSSRNVGRMYGVTPKFVRMQLLHEFLFYMYYGHKKMSTALSADILDLIDKENWAASDFSQYADAPDGYEFVPPARNFDDGWLTMEDVVKYIPVGLFSKMIFVSYYVKDLLEYINDPLKRKIIIKNLPFQMQRELIGSSRLISKMFENVINLTCIGLLQIGERKTNLKLKAPLYINKNAFLLNTTSTKPGYYKIEAKTYPKEIFKFDELSDVKKYWIRAKAICIETPLNSILSSIGEIVQINYPSSKFADHIKGVPKDRALTNDIGYIPGDNLGAGGYDSIFFAHLTRNWIDPEHRQAIKRKYTDKKPLLKNVASKNPALFVENIPLDGSRSTKLGRLRVVREKRKMKKEVDVVEQNAKRMLGSNTKCKWTSVESSMVYAASVAINIMMSNANDILMATLRDILHRCFQSYEKSKSACHRRITYVGKNPKNFDYFRVLLADFQEESHEIKKYRNLYSSASSLSVLKRSALEKFKMNFIELTRLLFGKLYEKSSNAILLCKLPTSLAALDENYIVESSPREESKAKFADVSSTVDIRCTVLRSIIHGHLACLLFKRADYRMLDTYRSFPEATVEAVLAGLRGAGIVSTQAEIPKMSGSGLRESHFKLSHNYVFNLAEWYQYKVFAQAHAYFRRLREEGVEGEDLGALNGGIAAVLLDLISMDEIAFDLVVPEGCATSSGPNYCVVDEEYGVNEDSAFDAEGSNVDANSFVSLADEKSSECDNNAANRASASKWAFRCDSLKLLKIPLANMASVYSECIKDALYSQNSSGKFSDPESSVEMKVFEFISSKEDLGATASELMGTLDELSMTKFELRAVLNKLCTSETIRPVGSATIRWVSTKYLKPWMTPLVKSSYAKNIPHIEEIVKSEGVGNFSNLEEIPKTTANKRKLSPQRSAVVSKKNRMENVTDESSGTTEVPEMLETEVKERQSDSIIDRNNTFVLPRPWIRPDGSVNVQLLSRWLASILSHLLPHSMLSLDNVQKRFKQLQPYHVRLLVELLSKIGCTRLVHVKKTKATLWSRSDAYLDVIGEATGLEDDAELYVEVIDGAIVKYTLFKEECNSRDEKEKPFCSVLESLLRKKV